VRGRPDRGGDRGGIAVGAGDLWGPRDRSGKGRIGPRLGSRSGPLPATDSVTADLVIRGARVYTVDPEQPWAEAVAIEGETIARVGSVDDVAELIGPGTRVIDANGQMVLPGFIDSHNHVRLGSNPLDVDLTGAPTLDEIKRRIRAHADQNPEMTW